MHLMPVFRPTCQYRRGFRNEPPTPTNEKSLHLAQATNSADTPLRQTTLTPGTLRELPSGRRWNWRRGACFLGDRPIPKRYDGNTQRSGGTNGRRKSECLRTTNGPSWGSKIGIKISDDDAKQQLEAGAEGVMAHGGATAQRPRAWRRRMKLRLITFPPLFRAYPPFTFPITTQTFNHG